jgi:hypothetical protein
VAADIPLERHVLDLFKGEHKAESYLKINPQGKVSYIFRLILFLYQQLQ